MGRKDVSPGLSQDELNAIINRDRDAAVRIAATLFRHEVAAAIICIGEINQIANARVTADCQVASAKMKTDAEVTGAILMSSAEIAILEVQKLSVDNGVSMELQKKIITGIGKDSSKAISDGAEKTINRIQAEAREAIVRINEGAAQAIIEINYLSMDIHSRITQCEEAAKEKLDRMRNEPHSPEALMKEAKEATAKINAEAAMAQDDLRKLTEKGIQGLNTATDKALGDIARAIADAEKHIVSTRDLALKRINELVARLLPG